MILATDEGPVAPPRRLVVDRTLECYPPGSQRRLDLWRCQYTLVHKAGLSHYEQGVNEQPVPDDELDGPTLAGRYRHPALGTGGEIPYPLLVRSSGVVEQLAPLGVECMHAWHLNPIALAVAVVGEDGPCSSAQLEALAEICALTCLITGGAGSLYGHTELVGATRDAHKICPRPTVDVGRLRDLVRARMPSGWQAYPHQQVEEILAAAGLVL